MKIVLIVLDGGGDIGLNTPLETAKKPNIDFLAKNGILGLLDIGYKKTIDSDLGYLTLLGCYSEKDYPGRGYLEALGVGLEPKESDICLRGDFATLGPDGNLIDRRAGRDETGLEEFAEKLNMEIDGIKFIVKKSSGHRVIVLMRGPGLSKEIIPNDPKKVGVPVSQIKPKKPEAKKTASVLNKFLFKAHKILEKQEINKKRKLPANIILIRNVGKKNFVKSFKERFGFKGCCIAGINIAKGVSRYLGLDVIEVPGANGMPDTNLSGKFECLTKALKDYDFVFFHINGTDILSHDKKREEKKKFIEKIDLELGKVLKKINLNETIIVITCDHRTASLKDFKGYEHLPDPVPVLISGNNIKPDKIEKFDEKNCEKGFKLKGNELISFILNKAYK